MGKEQHFRKSISDKIKINICKEPNWQLNLDSEKQRILIVKNQEEEAINPKNIVLSKHISPVNKNDKRKRFASISQEKQ